MTVQIHDVTTADTLGSDGHNCNGCGDRFTNTELVKLSFRGAVMFLCRKGCVPALHDDLEDVRGVI